MKLLTLAIILLALAILALAMQVADLAKEEDWLDCIEYEECSIDSAIPPGKAIRT